MSFIKEKTFEIKGASFEVWRSGIFVFLAQKVIDFGKQYSKDSKPKRISSLKINDLNKNRKFVVPIEVIKNLQAIEL